LVAHWISALLRLDVLEGDGEVDEVQVDVTETPGVVLLLGHGEGVFVTVIVVPQLGGDEYFLALYQTLVDGLSDALTSLFLVLIVIRSIE
jgi:hypothetical protein